MSLMALIQRARRISKVVADGFRGGRFIDTAEALATLDGTSQGLPATTHRTAISGYPVGGPDGTSIDRQFEELQEDLEVAFEAYRALETQYADSFAVFSLTRDRLANALRSYRQDVQALTFQLSGIGADSFVDSFQTLDYVDLDRSTVALVADEGLVTPYPDTSKLSRYDGNRVKLVGSQVPPKSSERGGSFLSCFRPYRAESWYGVATPGSQWTFDVNVTGVDYEAGASEDVPINGIRVDVATPLEMSIQWSPDGLNWHDLEPTQQHTVESTYTFLFRTVVVGYLRFRIKQATEEVAVKQITIFRQGYADSAELYSTRLPGKLQQFATPVRTVKLDIEAYLPAGTSIEAYCSRSSGGPWTQLGSSAVDLGGFTWSEIPINMVSAEITGSSLTPYRASIPDASIPLPETAEMLAGDEQVLMSAFARNWVVRQDRLHIPSPSDWTDPTIRSGPVSHIPGGIGTGHVSGTTFSSSRNPLTVDVSGSQAYNVLCLLQDNGTWVMRQGHTYRLTAWLWCAAPTTLEGQRVGVVNTGGPSSGAVVAPLAVYLNGQQTYQSTLAVNHVNALSGAAQQSTYGLQQGWNRWDLMFQIPSDVVAGASGVASSGIYLYFQPCFFERAIRTGYGIQSVRAWRDPWPMTSEEDIRAGSLGVRERWSWTLDRSSGKITGVLFPYNPLVSSSETTSTSFQTIDGQNSPSPAKLALRYLAAQPTSNSLTGLWLRFLMNSSEGAAGPPRMAGYRLTVS